MRNALISLGTLSLLFGGWHAFDTSSFLKKASRVEATVTGYSSIQKLDRIEGDCSAFRKGCAVDVSYTLPSGQQINTTIPQPLFARTPEQKITLFVNPEDPLHPRMASLHVLFRNATSTIFLGIACLFLAWLIGKNPKKNLTASSN